MSEEQEYRSGIAAMIDLAAQIDLDRQMPHARLRSRDREIGKELSSRNESPGAQLLAWLSRVTGRDHPRFGARVAGVLQAGTLLLFLAGGVLGWLAAAAVFSYDGSLPVNVIHILAVFVALQIILLMLLLVTVLPRNLFGWIPGSSSIVEALELLRPGRLQKLAYRGLPVDLRTTPSSLFGASRSHRLLFGGVEKWTALYSSQLFAVAFNGGALLGCLYLIVFSDLAFSWSTTLRLEADDIHALTSALAGPWSALVPDARPPLALIEASRYYRLKEGLLPLPVEGPASGPEALGGWWPFLVMCMIFYGLLPRLLLAGIARVRLDRSIDHALLHLPGVAELLDRMNRGLVQTRSHDPEDDPSASTPETGSSPEDLPGGAFRALVNWGEVPVSDEKLHQLAGREGYSPPRKVLRAGGANTIAHDAEVIEEVALFEGGGGVLVFVKAWEPPLEDLLDFLGQLRGALSASAPLVVAPVGIDRQSSPEPPGVTQLEIWASKLRSLGDPWLRVHRLQETA